MYFYQYMEHYLCGLTEDFPFPTVLPEEALSQGKELYFLVRRDPMHSKASFAVTIPELLFQETEGLHWLNRHELASAALDERLLRLILKGKVKGINTAYPDFAREFQFQKSTAKKRVNLLALGDVGSTVLIGLKLLGGKTVGSIGICDMKENTARRFESELNQVAIPWDYDALPEVEIIGKEQLFDGDAFIFCASKGVPPVGGDTTDVRMVQFTGNAAIIGEYARQAREKNFQGLFAVVSDPVDPLCKAAFLESNQNEEGDFDFMGLRPEQIQGYGLGVMNSRAAYYAKKEEKYRRFLKEGRAYGPHGQGLVIADSISNYNDTLSLELTQLAIEANLRTRELGFKPYIAPALSSAAISLILTLEGKWHYSSNFLGGVYMGAKNRTLPAGLEMEALPLPEELYRRLQRSYEDLRKIL